MKITKVSVFEVTGERRLTSRELTQRQVQAIDIYPEIAAQVRAVRATPDQQRRAAYVQIDTDEGVFGLFGPIGEPAGQIPAIKRDLGPLLVGRNPLAINLLHDLMFRLDRHGRSGHFVTAISSLDCALWDLKGKAWAKPVFELLGGPTRGAVPAYASMLGFSVEPDSAAAAAREMVAAGFPAQKWFFAYGPVYGAGGGSWPESALPASSSSPGAATPPKSVEESISRNIEMAIAVREAVGPHYPLMFDAYMGWDLPYAMTMARLLEPINPFWLEEPLAPEQTEGFRRLKESTRLPLATGEHIYGIRQARDILAAGNVAVLQNDPEWTGGITELSRVCTLASAYDVPVVAHGHGLLPALHVAASQSPATVPYVEYLLGHQAAKQYFHLPMNEPVAGMVHLPSTAGLGFMLDPEKIETRRQL